MSANTFKIDSTASRFGNVTIERTKGQTAVKLHGNAVIIIDHIMSEVILSNCGWVTPTTHKVINNALNQLGLGHVNVRGEKGHTWIYGVNMANKLVNGTRLKLSN
jgi:hypothetical protein